MRHVSVLLRKDVLTLKRNVIFLLSFFVLPVTMMVGFSYMQTFLEGQLQPEQHNFQSKFLDCLMIFYSSEQANNDSFSEMGAFSHE
jgi:hypothetical protein